MSQAALVCARSAVLFWDLPTAITMVAIAGAESNWNREAGGDSPAQLEAAGAYESAKRAREWNCPTGSDHGPSSWGYWQINVGWNHDFLVPMSGFRDPCWIASWLKIGSNNARAANVILGRQGFDAWTVYRHNIHLNYIDEATSAVHQARWELEYHWGIWPIDEGGDPIVDFDDSKYISTLSGINPIVLTLLAGAGIYGVYYAVKN